MMSAILLGHDVCNILASLDICDHNKLALYTLLNEANLHSHMLHSLMRKIVSLGNGNCSCIVNPHTGAINNCFFLLFALQFKQ